MRWTVSQVGDASPEQVWRRYVDLDAWAHWAPFITAVDADDRHLREGLRGAVIAVGGLRVRFVVLAVDSSHRTWRWRAWLGPVTLVLHHEVLSRPTSGCVAALELVGSAPVVVGYRVPAQLALRSLVRP